MLNHKDIQMMLSLVQILETLAQFVVVGLFKILVDVTHVRTVMLNYAAVYNKELTYANLYTDRRSEEHTSELQSRFDIVCRLLLEQKKNSSISTRRFNNRIVCF